MNDFQQQGAVDVNAAVHAFLPCLSQGCVMYLARWLTVICYEVVVLGHLDIESWNRMSVPGLITVSTLPGQIELYQ